MEGGVRLSRTYEGGAMPRFRGRNQTAISHPLAYPLAVERAMENPNYATTGMGYNPRSQHSQASKLGRRHMMPMEGAGWWDDFKQGFRSVGDTAIHPLLSVLPYGNLASAGLRAVGLGRTRAGGRSKAGSNYGMGRSKAGAMHFGRTQMMPEHMEGGMEGAGWWDDFKQGFRSVGDVALHPLLSVLPYGNLASAGLRAVGLGKARAGGRTRAGAMSKVMPNEVKLNEMRQPHLQRMLQLENLQQQGMGKARAGRKPAGSSNGRMSRASIVAKVMKEQGLPLGQASKYVKTHNLY
jgi:hypothetical protein